jgi:Domain of unknown function (DUF4386)
MNSEKSVGRTVGVLLLLHLTLGLMVPFILLDGALKPGGFVAMAAGNSGQVRAAVLLLFVGSAIPIAIASAAWSVLRQYSSAMGLWLVALAVAGFSLQAVDNAQILTMLSLSQEYAKVGAANTELFQTLAVVVGAARKWAHFTYLLIAVVWMFLLFCVLFRFRLVPRALTALGAVASVLQIAGVSLRAIFGYPLEMRLAYPLGPAYLLLAVWLMVKGFNEDHRPTQAGTHEAELVRA